MRIRTGSKTKVVLILQHLFFHSTEGKISKSELNDITNVITQYTKWRTKGTYYQLLIKERNYYVINPEVEQYIQDLIPNLDF